MKRLAAILTCTCAVPVFAQASAKDIYVNAVIGGVSVGGLILLIGMYRLVKLLVRKVQETISATSQTMPERAFGVATRPRPDAGPAPTGVPTAEGVPELSARVFADAAGNEGLANGDSSEALWAAALAEFEGIDRRPGLWARVFAEAQGNEGVAKAAYLRARVIELQQEQEATAAAMVRATAEAEQKRLAEEARRRSAEAVYAALPKGGCPNSACGAIIPLSSQACPKCGALFDEGAAWNVLPIRTT